MSGETWADTHRPKTLDTYRGNSKTIKKLLEWAKNWKNRKTKAVLLHGPPGTGKTVLAELIAEDLDRELYETNASDVRTKKQLQQTLAQAVKQRSFTGKEKIILIDEIDGLSSSDRGGASTISSIIDESKFPLILTANDPYANGMKQIRRKSNLFELSSVHTNSVAAELRSIADAENVTYKKGAMKSIARRAGGDMRSAINDLQTLSETNETITKDTVKQLSYRDTKKGIFEGLKILFKTTDASTASDALDDVDEDYGTLFQWIRENVPKEYTDTEDRARAMDMLSEADKIKGRMEQNQDWRLLSYLYELMTVGVALSKEEPYKGFTRYSYPSRIKKMGKTKAKRKKRDDIAAKIAGALHTSFSTSRTMIPFIALFFERDDWKQNIIDQMELTEDEIEFIESY